MRSGIQLFTQGFILWRCEQMAGYRIRT